MTETQLAALPDALRIDAKGLLAALPIPAAKTWSFTLAPKTGKFRGSFVVSDPAVPPATRVTARTVSMEGVLLQLPAAE